MDRFEDLATEWFEKEKGRWSADHRTNVWESINANVLPQIGHLNISSIQSSDILALIRKIEERGALDVAGRIKQRLASVFRYAINTGKTDRNPVDSLKDVIKTRKVKHRAALHAEELPAVLQALDQYASYKITKLALEFNMLTFVRPGELRRARWAEINVAKK